MSLKSTERLQVPALSAKAKHAIKFGLAMVISYYLALNFSWMSPTWAATSVAMCALPTAGESLAKGVLRAQGTLVAFAVGLFFLALFPQDRWWTLLALTTYLAFVSYKMTGRNGEYAWFVAGFVVVKIVLTSGHDDPAHNFLFAAYRTLETLFGISIWTLISVFVWPETNLNGLHGLSGQLLDAQRQALDSYRQRLPGLKADEATGGTQGECETLLARLGPMIEAAGTESYEVRRAQTDWTQLQALSRSFVAMRARLESGLSDLQQVEVERALPGVDGYLNMLCLRLDQAGALFRDEPIKQGQSPCSLELDRSYVEGLDHFHRAAVEVVLKELSDCADIVNDMLRCAANIKECDLEKEQIAVSSPIVTASAKSAALPFVPTPLDPERVKYSFFIVSALWVGFFIWIYIDPPGHTAWPYFMTVIALIAMRTPERKFRKAILWSSAYATSMLVYIFIMPELSQFWQLAIVLFVMCALFSYLLPRAVVTPFYLGMFSTLGISNSQQYDVAHMMNTVLYIFLAMLTIYALSFIVGSPRPHQVCLKMLKRYFHSSGVVLESIAEPDTNRTFFARQRFAYHQHEVRTLPAKLATWSRQIDSKQLPGEAPLKLQGLITSMKIMSLRLDDLWVLRQTISVDPWRGDVTEEIAGWRRALASSFEKLARGEELRSVEKVSMLLKARLERLNAACELAINQNDSMTDDELRQLYQMLGCLRNLSQSGLVYLDLAHQINWHVLKEEHF